MPPQDQILIFDTTLRDGEQSPGATMTPAEKLHIARALEVLGVDVIEAGFPAASAGEARCVQTIAEAVGRCGVAALCRTRERDIRTAWASIRDAASPRLHVFIATSDIHLEHKLGMSREEVLREIAAGVGLCRALCPDVEFSAEDATRTDLGFLREAVACAMEAGATVLNIPDTVGYTMPAEYAGIIEAVVAEVGSRKVVVSSHCHDDLGLAVANSIAAVSAGARQVECTVNGIGERAGNAALEEVVMALRTRRDLLGRDTAIQARSLVATSRMVSEITGMLVPPNKAVVGRNAFAHESGIHQHGVLSERRTYEIMAPEDVGFAESSIVLGKLSGRHALRERLGELGYALDKDQLGEVFGHFKELADKKKHIYEEDLHALMATAVRDRERTFVLDDIRFQSGSNVAPSAEVTLRVHGETLSAQATGDGPVNAAFRAIRDCTGMDDVELAEYGLEAITWGSDAQGRVVLLITQEGRRARGHATHTDVVVASARAFVDALNHLVLQAEVQRMSRAVEVGEPVREVGT